MKLLAWCIDPNGIKNKHIVKDHTLLVSKKSEILTIDKQMV